MSDWFSYRLGDFLMYSPRTYYRLVELYNAALWPLHAAAFALGIAIVGLCFYQQRAAMRIMVGLLSICWFWVAGAFLYARYASIHWAGSYMAALFMIEAMLLLVAAFWQNDRIISRRSGMAATTGVALVIFAVLILPLAGPLANRPWSQVELFGLTPDATALATVGALVLAGRRELVAAFIIPVAWCLYSAATHWTMGV